ncbi:hypothetical protein B296_00014904, partial [Ensete ventricosum]
FKAFEACIENRLQELFNKFKRSLSENPNKSQHGESSNLKGNRSEKYDQEQDTGYPCMRVEFPDGKMEIQPVGSHGLKSSLTST